MKAHRVLSFWRCNESTRSSTPRCSSQLWLPGIDPSSAAQHTHIHSHNYTENQLFYADPPLKC
uniref:Uncharacterized protein n=1 Tax=Physcomitrium patens TaxID=3218 RepID=A0A2K1JM03_PHYPA|nr:hypothetical protein PHYPA_017404 [Physcomitrium patens]